MNIFTKNNDEFQYFLTDIKNIITDITPLAKEEDITGLKRLIVNFKIKTD